jgi:hypothetical protein
VADRETRVSFAVAGASGVCRQARGLITINVLSNPRAAVHIFDGDCEAALPKLES